VDALRPWSGNVKGSVSENGKGNANATISPCESGIEEIENVSGRNEKRLGTRSEPKPWPAARSVSGSGNVWLARNCAARRRRRAASGAVRDETWISHHTAAGSDPWTP